MAKYDGLFEYLLIGTFNESIRLVQSWVLPVALVVTAVVVVAFIITMPTDSHTKAPSDTD